MSCNGCRILRKGCNDNCILRQSLQGIESPQAQANATVFVAKFFGRAGLMSFLSAVPESQRPALFQSLLYEACGRTVNPVSGVVGLLWTGNWHLCQSAAETVLRGGHLRAMNMEDLPKSKPTPLDDHEDTMMMESTLDDEEEGSRRRMCLNMTSGFPSRVTAAGRVKRRSVTPEESETTTMESRFDSDYNNFPNLKGGGEKTKLLRLFF